MIWCLNVSVFAGVQRKHKGEVAGLTSNAAAICLQNRQSVHGALLAVASLLDLDRQTHPPE